MTIRPDRLALRLCWVGMALASAGTGAQPTPATASEGRDAMPHPSAVAPAAGMPAPEEYVDRVLDDSPLPIPPEEIEALRTGWPRSYSIEAQALKQSSGAISADSQALLFSAHLDTPNHGALSANLNLNRNSTPIHGLGLPGSSGLPYALAPDAYRTGSNWRVDQRGMPFDEGWLGHGSIGHIHTTTSPLARGLGRVSLPIQPIEGVAIGIERPDRTSVNASAGRLGYFDGLPVPGFSPRQGSAASTGAQTQLSGGNGPLALNRTDAALQFIDAHHVHPNGAAGDAQHTRAAWAAASWQGVAPWADAVGHGIGGIGERVGGLRVQANLARSTTRPSGPGSLARPGAATGAWIDAAWRTGLLQQSASVFRFEPLLRWGAVALPSDLQGASWRSDLITRQWQAGAYIEFSNGVSRRQDASVYGNLYGRYRLDSRDSVSSTLAARSGRFAAQSAQFAWEHKSGWGYTQWRTDLAHGVNLRAIRAGVDHAWNVGETQTLSTSLSFENSRTANLDARTWIWGILGTTPLPGGARLDLSARGSHGIASRPRHFLNANARLAWPLGGGWSFVAQYAAARGQEPFHPAVLSALTTATLQPAYLTPASRTLLVALRHEARAGVSRAPIGGGPGSGSGRIEGYVYFDHDNNGRREASEGGVPGVTVVVNRRHVARTDAQGFYSFPAVTGGSHEIELLQDTMPLPWGSADASSRRIDVYVRDIASADFPIRMNR